MARVVPTAFAEDLVVSELLSLNEGAVSLSFEVGRVEVETLNVTLDASVVPTHWSEA